jgi:hypothetical protein
MPKSVFLFVPSPVYIVRDKSKECRVELIDCRDGGGEQGNRRNPQENLPENTGGRPREPAETLQLSAEIAAGSPYRLS